MNEYQNKIYELASKQNLGKLSLRKIAELINADNKPQIVKHHLLQLKKKGLLRVDLSKDVIEVLKKGVNSFSGSNSIFSIPIVGSANCGSPTIYADERVEGHLRVSSKKLPHRKNNLYILIASGNSMNAINFKGKSISDGDYVIVDSTTFNPSNGDVVVFVIDGMASIKKYKADPSNNQIVLISESKEKGHHPIFIHEDDNFVLSGKVVDIIKKVKI